MKKIKISKELFTGIVAISIVIGMVVLGIYIAKLLTRKYIYVDMNGSTGSSYKCYYNEGSQDLRCMIPVKVQQYFREK